MSDPRLTPEELERIAELRRRILERHPDVDEVNARIRSMLATPPRLIIATERKEANRQALVLLTAAAGGLDDLIPDLIAALGDDLPLVMATSLGLIGGLFEGLDEEQEGFSDHWLRCVGVGVEAMPEGGE